MLDAIAFTVWWMGEFSKHGKEWGFWGKNYPISLEGAGCAGCRLIGATMKDIGWYSVDKR